jgi:hypothetical protein
MSGVYKASVTLMRGVYKHLLQSEIDPGRRHLFLKVHFYFVDEGITCTSLFLDHFSVVLLSLEGHI